MVQDPHNKGCPGMYPNEKGCLVEAERRWVILVLVGWRGRAAGVGCTSRIPFKLEESPTSSEEPSTVEDSLMLER